MFYQDGQRFHPMNTTDDLNLWSLHAHRSVDVCVYVWFLRSWESFLRLRKSSSYQGTQHLHGNSLWGTDIADISASSRGQMSPMAWSPQDTCVIQLQKVISGLQNPEIPQLDEYLSSSMSSHRWRKWFTWGHTIIKPSVEVRSFLPTTPVLPSHRLDDFLPFLALPHISTVSVLLVVQKDWLPLHLSTVGCSHHWPCSTFFFCCCCCLEIWAPLTTKRTSLKSFWQKPQNLSMSETSPAILPHL